MHPLLLKKYFWLNFLPHVNPQLLRVYTHGFIDKKLILSTKMLYFQGFSAYAREKNKTS